MRPLMTALLIILAASAYAGDQPYLEIYATSGLTLTEESGAEGGPPTWAQDEYVGMKVVGRLCWRDFALVGRGEGKGLPGQFAYDRPGSFTALVGDAGMTWTTLAWRGA